MINFLLCVDIEYGSSLGAEYSNFVLAKLTTELLLTACASWILFGKGWSESEVFVADINGANNFHAISNMKSLVSD